MCLLRISIPLRSQCPAKCCPASTCMPLSFLLACSSGWRFYPQEDLPFLILWGSNQMSLQQRSLCLQWLIICHYTYPQNMSVLWTGTPCGVVILSILMFAQYMWAPLLVDAQYFVNTCAKELVAWKARQTRRCGKGKCSFLLNCLRQKEYLLIDSVILDAAKEIWSPDAETS